MRLVGSQCTLPGVLMALDLEPLLRGALLAEMAAVLLRAEPPERQGFTLCPRCGALVPNESWELDGSRWRLPLRCRNCLQRAASAQRCAP